MIDELSESAKEELKRADHSIYVTLKYTRTIDVIKNTIKRLISSYDLAILELLEFLKSKKKVQNIPNIAKLRAELVEQTLPKASDYIAFYFNLKRIDRAEYTKREEYRKNATLIAMVEHGKNVDVNIEALKDYYKKTVEFVDFVDQVISGTKVKEQK